MAESFSCYEWFSIRIAKGSNPQPFWRFSQVESALHADSVVETSDVRPGVVARIALRALTRPPSPPSALPASGRRGGDLNGFKNVYLKAKTIRFEDLYLKVKTIRPCRLSCVTTVVCVPCSLDRGLGALTAKDGSLIQRGDGGWHPRDRPP